MRNMKVCIWAIKIPSANTEKLGINTGGNKWKLKEGQRARIRK